MRAKPSLIGSRTCAIVGGVLTLAALLDSIVFATGKALKKGGLSGVTGNGYTKAI